MSPVPSWPFPSAAQIVDRFCLDDAPLFDRLMAIAIADSQDSDEDKWWSWALHGMSIDPARRMPPRGMRPKRSTPSSTEAHGAPSGNTGRLTLEAAALRAVDAAPLAVYVRAMSLLRGTVIALEHVTRRKLARN